MNSLSLDEVLVKHDPEAVISLFRGMSESDRKGFSRRAIDWFRVSLLANRFKGNPWLSNSWMFNGMPERDKKNILEVKEIEKQLPRQASHVEALEASKVAMLATCGLTEIRKYGASAIPKAEYCRRVLQDRKPKWLGKWMDFACEERPITHWAIVREMERTGLAAAQRNSGYWRAMVMSLPQSDESVIEVLKEDPEYFQHHIWAILDDEPTMSILSNPFETEDWRAMLRRFEDSWAYMNEITARRTRANEAWHKTFIDVARDELVDKERFKERILYWIARIGSDDQMKDAPSFMKAMSRIGWFSAIFDAMELSDDEKADLVPKLVGLLTSKNTDVLRWSLKRLSAYSPEVIPIEDLAVNMGSLFRVKGKDHSLEAIKFLKKLSDDRPDDRSKIACVVLAGLEHQSQEVQKRALDFVEKRNLADDPDVASELKYRSEALSGLLKERADKLLGPMALAGCAAMHVVEPEQDFTSEIEELKLAGSKLSDQLGVLCGIDDALKAVSTLQEASQGNLSTGGAALAEDIVFAPALTLNAMDVPRLDPQLKIKPISDIDDLVYQLLHILEAKPNWDEVELCLDGLARLTAENTSDLAQRLTPLRKKVVDMLSTPNEWTGAPAPFSNFDYKIDLAAVCFAWTDRFVIEPKTGMSNPLVGLANFVAGTPWAVHYKAPWGSWQAYGRVKLNDPQAFLSKRLLSLARQIAKQKCFPLLSSPTHKGGWIEPVTLVERMIAWNNHKQRPDSADFIQALLRLAPDSREEALDAAQSLPGEMADALRFALGGKLGPNPTKAEWWVAAARGRLPRGDFDELTKAFPGLGPDATVAARYKDDVGKLAEYYLPTYSVRPVGIFSPIPEFKPRPDVVLFPTELMHSPADSLVLVGPVLTSIWLQDRESYFAMQARNQAANIDSQSSFWEGTWEPIFDPDVSVTGFARWCLVIGLTSKHADNARMALDALVACIEDCRIDGIVLGDAMAEILTSGKVTLVRWIRALKDCARVSPLHLQVVRIAVERSLSNTKNSTMSTPIKLIELLYDLCSESGECVSTARTREYLESLGTKGKTGQLAKSLLSLQKGRADRHRAEAALQALRSRIQRADRYNRILHSRAGIGHHKSASRF